MPWQGGVRAYSPDQMLCLHYIIRVLGQQPTTGNATRRKNYEGTRTKLRVHHTWYLVLIGFINSVPRFIYVY